MRDSTRPGVPTRTCGWTLSVSFCVFKGTPPEAFGEMPYSEQAAALTAFAKDVEEEAGAAAGAALRYRTAAALYNMAMPADPAATAASKPKPKVAKDEEAPPVDVKLRLSSEDVNSKKGAHDELALAALQ